MLEGKLPTLSHAVFYHCLASGEFFTVKVSILIELEHVTLLGITLSIWIAVMESSHLENFGEQLQSSFIVGSSLRSISDHIECLFDVRLVGHLNLLLQKLTHLHRIISMSQVNPIDSSVLFEFTTQQVECENQNILIVVLPHIQRHSVIVVLNIVEANTCDIGVYQKGSIVREVPHLAGVIGTTVSFSFDPVPKIWIVESLKVDLSLICVLGETQHRICEITSMRIVSELVKISTQTVLTIVFA